MNSSQWNHLSKFAEFTNQHSILISNAYPTFLMYLEFFFHIYVFISCLWLTLVSDTIIDKEMLILMVFGAPGWLSLLSVWLQPRSWSCGSRRRAPHWALSWQLRAWRLLQILCLPFPLSLSSSCSVSPSIKKIKKKNIWY